MHFAMRLGGLEAVEKLEINPLLPLRNVIRATLIFGEPADASQRKVKVFDTPCKSHDRFSRGARARMISTPLLGFPSSHISQPCDVRFEVL
jgi:hypothetical protein